MMFKRRKKPEYILAFERMLQKRLWNVSTEYDPEGFFRTNQALRKRLKGWKNKKSP